MWESLKTQEAVPAFHDTLNYFISYITYHLYTIWLFTYSDIKTIVIPKTVFGSLSAMAATSFGISASTAPTTSEVIQRIPTTLFWVWITLLPFAIDNQRDANSVAEDAINKPWRVMPSRRLSPKEAKRLMICLYAVSITSSWWIGGFLPGVALLILGFWYNQLGGSDNSCVIRNLINGLGYNCFATGATEVALGHSLMPYKTLPRTIHTLLHPDRTEFLQFWIWVAILVAVISTTAHAQDMHDQGGDGLRGRRTVPLVIGDSLARVSMVIGVGFWTVACCSIWGVVLLPWILVSALALVVSVRICLYRTVEADKRTFLLWNAWITSVYMLPSMKQLFP